MIANLCMCPNCEDGKILVIERNQGHEEECPRCDGLGVLPVSLMREGEVCEPRKVEYVG